jgi:hypothetical protein
MLSATTTAVAIGDQSTHPPRCDAPQNGTHDSAALRTEVLRHVVAETEPAELPTRWRFLRKSPNVRRLRGDRRDLTTSLQQRFREEDLVAVRILVRAKDNELELSPVFGDISSKFLLICDASHQAVDAISARGMLSSSDPPYLVHGLACHSKDAPGERRGMVLASSDDDLHVLHELRINCMAASGLESLSGKHARQLFFPSVHVNCQHKIFFLRWPFGRSQTSSMNRHRSRSNIIGDLQRSR